MFAGVFVELLFQFLSKFNLRMSIYKNCAMSGAIMSSIDNCINSPYNVYSQEFQLLKTIS